jgi:hypothetical protein
MKIFRKSLFLSLLLSLITVPWILSEAQAQQDQNLIPFRDLVSFSLEDLGIEKPEDAVSGDYYINIDFAIDEGRDILYLVAAISEEGFQYWNKWRVYEIELSEMHDRIVRINEKKFVPNNEWSGLPTRAQIVPTEDGFYFIGGQYPTGRFQTGDVFVYSSETGELVKDYDDGNIDFHPANFVMNGQLTRFVEEKYPAVYVTPQQASLNTYIDGVGWHKEYLPMQFLDYPRESLYVEKDGQKQLYLFSCRPDANFVFDLASKSISRFHTLYERDYYCKLGRPVQVEQQIHFIRSLEDQMKVVIFDMDKGEFLGDYTFPLVRTEQYNQREIYGGYHLIPEETDEGDGYRLQVYDPTMLENGEKHLINTDSWYNTQLAVSELYRSVLKRGPDIEGLDYWTAKLYNGEVTMAQIKTFMQESSEYKETTAEAFIANLYRTKLLREPDLSGWYYWADQAIENEVPLAEIEASFLDSEEVKKLVR